MPDKNPSTPVKDDVSAAVSRSPDLLTTDGIPVKQKTWAHAVNGVVVECRKAVHYLTHPFGEKELKPQSRVLDVTGVPCEVGYLADAKGQVTPTEGRQGLIPDGLPAYHAGPAPTHTSAQLAAELAMSETQQGEPPAAPDATPTTVIATNTEKDRNPALPKNADSADKPDPAISSTSDKK